MISVSLDRDVRRLRGLLSKEDFRKGQSRVLNDVGRKVQTVTNRGIRDRLALKARDVKSAMSVSRATPQRLQWRLEVAGRPLSLRMFGAKQTRKGVTVRIRPKSKRLLLARSFIGPNDQVFRRKGRSRLPIVKLTGPSIPRAMAKRIVQRAQQKMIQDTYSGAMVRELEFRIEKARKR